MLTWSWHPYSDFKCVAFHRCVQHRAQAWISLLPWKNTELNYNDPLFYFYIKHEGTGVFTKYIKLFLYLLLPFKGFPYCSITDFLLRGHSFLTQIFWAGQWWDLMNTASLKCYLRWWCTEALWGWVGSRRGPLSTSQQAVVLWRESIRDKLARVEGIGALSLTQTVVWCENQCVMQLIGFSWQCSQHTFSHTSVSMV